MSEIKILWVDDEIELLKPHLLFLEKKNYKVTTCNNGAEAVETIDEESVRLRELILDGAFWIDADAKTHFDIPLE